MRFPDIFSPRQREVTTSARAQPPQPPDPPAIGARRRPFDHDERARSRRGGTDAGRQIDQPPYCAMSTTAVEGGCRPRTGPSARLCQPWGWREGAVIGSDDRFAPGLRAKRQAARRRERAFRGFVDAAEGSSNSGIASLPARAHDVHASHRHLALATRWQIAGGRKTLHVMATRQGRPKGFMRRRGRRRARQFRNPVSADTTSRNATHHEDFI